MSGDAAAAFAHCEEVTRRCAKHFYHGLRLTPRPRRDGCYAVYAWMRMGDDIADDPRVAIEDRRAALDAFADATRELLDHGAPALGPVGVALAESFRRWPIERDVCELMIEGLRSDLDAEACGGVRFADDAQLDAYCERVGSTAGRACVSIWGLREGVDPALARAMAVDRGIAFQRTNILRDVRADLRDGRVYLPADALARHGLSPEDVAAWRQPERCGALVAEQARYARERYRRSGELDRLVAPDCARVLRTMTALYSALLTRVERAPASVARGRVRLSRVGKVVVALGAAARPAPRVGGPG